MTVRLARALRRALARGRLMLAAESADAFLASYPKSGRTWFRFILANYLNMAAGLGVDVDLRSMFAILPNFDLDPVRGIPAFRGAGHQQVPKVLVSHLPYRRLLYRRRPVVFMVRDPRDLMVSAYFHATRHKHRFSGDASAFLRDPRQGLPHLIAYLNGWAAGLARHRHHVVTYERLSAEPEAVTAETLAFLGLPVDAGIVRRAVAASRFETMRSLELTEGIPAHAYDRSDTESLRMRRGKVGGFADYLAPSDIAWLETTCVARLHPAARRLVAATGCTLGASSPPPRPETPGIAAVGWTHETP
jgi:alcohol sulfotransferase